MRKSLICLGAAILMVGMVIGCGSNNGLVLAKARGKITHKGEPIKYGSIMFKPEQPGPPAIGSINADGTFVLSTESAGDGAVVGAHRVAVIGLEEDPSAGKVEMPDPTTSPREYMVAKTKAATRPIRGGGAGSYTDKSGKTFRITTPEWFGKPDTSSLKATVARGSNVFEIAINEDGSAQISP